MAIRSEFLDRDLTKEEEKEADTNKDGTVSKEELKAFEEEEVERQDKRMKLGWPDAKHPGKLPGDEKAP